MQTLSPWTCVVDRLWLQPGRPTRDALSAGGGAAGPTKLDSAWNLNYLIYELPGGMTSRTNL